jgi:hypothetical protein
MERQKQRRLAKLSVMNGLDRPRWLDYPAPSSVTGARPVLLCPLIKTNSRPETLHKRTPSRHVSTGGQDPYPKSRLRQFPCKIKRHPPPKGHTHDTLTAICGKQTIPLQTRSIMSISPWSHFVEKLRMDKARGIRSAQHSGTINSFPPGCHSCGSP